MRGVFLEVIPFVIHWSFPFLSLVEHLFNSGWIFVVLWLGFHQILHAMYEASWAYDPGITWDSLSVKAQNWRIFRDSIINFKMNQANIILLWTFSNNWWLKSFVPPCGFSASYDIGLVFSKSNCAGWKTKIKKNEQNEGIIIFTVN